MVTERAVRGNEAVRQGSAVSSEDGGAWRARRLDHARGEDQAQGSAQRSIKGIDGRSGRRATRGMKLFTAMLTSWLTMLMAVQHSSAQDGLAAGDGATASEPALTAKLTARSPIQDPLAINHWQDFPSGSAFYVVGYRDLVSGEGGRDYDDLTVAYKVTFGLNRDGDVVAIAGTAYLLSRNSAFSHDWHLALEIPDTSAGHLTCATFVDEDAPRVGLPCPGNAERHPGGRFDVVAFNDTRQLFSHPGAALYVDAREHDTGPWKLRYLFGPRTEFKLALEAPVSLAQLHQAPFQPYLNVRDSVQQGGEQRRVGKLLTEQWTPPVEFIDPVPAQPNYGDLVGTQGQGTLQWVKTALPDASVSIPGESAWSW